MSRVRDGFYNVTRKCSMINSRFSEGHGKDQKDWLWWKYSILKDFCHSSPRTYQGKKRKNVNNLITNINGTLEANNFQTCGVIIKIVLITVMEFIIDLRVMD